MRIGFDATPLHRERGGIGTYTEELVRALLGDESLEVVLMSNRPVALDRPLPGRVSAHIGPPVPSRGLWVQSAMSHRVDRLALDLVHFPNFLSPRIVGMPHVVTVHDAAILRHPGWFDRTKRTVTRRLLPRAARSADAIVTVSDFSRREILATLPVDPRRVHVVREAPARSYFDPVPPEECDRVREEHRLPVRYVFALGSWEPRKNHLRLLAAMRRVRDTHPDVHLVCAGRARGATPELRRALRRGRHEGWVHPLGYVPRAHVRPLLANAICTAYVSLYEGFGLPVLESMAAGTPVVTSNGSALAEIAGDAAECVDPEEVESIAAGIGRLLDSAALRSDRRDAGRRHASAFSWEHAADQTSAVYRRVLGRSHAGARRRWATAPPLTVIDGAASPLRGPVSVSRQADGLLAAILYADLFDYPLAVDELAANTIGARVDPLTAERLLEADPRLRERVAVSEGHVFFRGRGHLVARRREQAATTDVLLARHARTLAVLAGLPFLRMLAFSGGTSHKNSSSRHDIDLFVVTAPGRTWLVYLLIVFVSRLARCRDAICANYLIDEDHLELPRSGDLFSAHELLYTRPIVGEDVRRRLFELNRWIFERYPNHEGAEPWPVVPDDSRREPRRRRWERALRPVAGFLDMLARRGLELWVGRHLRPVGDQDVTLDDGVMKLHLHDHRGPFIRRFRQRLDAEGILTKQTDPVPGTMGADKTDPVRTRTERATP